jgi:DNA-binding transcriptional regulator YhcF (GntR family)
MPDAENPQPPPIVALAERIAADIRARRLRPGDAYPGTAETAARFRVSGTTANRALQLLAHRGVLERRQRSGTFVADPAGRAAPSLRRVTLLVHREHLRTEGLLEDGVVLGLQGGLPDADIRFGFLPAAEEEEYVARLIAEAMGPAGPEGFVLYRSSVRTQRQVRDSGLPAVVNGCLHPSIEGLANIDRDQAEMGRLLVTHLLERGAERIAVLFRDRPTAGDALLLDAAMQTAGAAGLDAGAVMLRFLPADEQAIGAAAAAILSAAGRPVGFLCRSEPLAAGAAAAVGRRRQAGRRRPPIVVADVYRRDPAAPAFPHIAAEIGPQELGRRIGLMLARQVRGDRTPAESVRIPVKLLAAPG